jgi:23S rRNA pseudouridine2605 synthase
MGRGLSDRGFFFTSDLSFAMQFPMRLNRFLSACGLGSRRGCEELILNGKVQINGSLCVNLGTQVGAEDKVVCNGRPLHLRKDIVIALNKPVGYVCTRADERDRRTIYDLLKPEFQTLHHVGRLDMDSSGLILLTNRGELSHKLTHPSHGVEKEYEVVLEESFDEGKLRNLIKGMMTPEGFARAERAWLISPRRVGMVLKQGLKRQIRHMLYSLGHEVKELERVRFGNIFVKGMPEGSWRELSAKEISELDSLAERKSAARPLPPKKGPRGVRPGLTGRRTTGDAAPSRKAPGDGPKRKTAGDGPKRKPVARSKRRPAQD